MLRGMLVTWWECGPILRCMGSPMGTLGKSGKGRSQMTDPITIAGHIITFWDVVAACYIVVGVPLIFAGVAKLLSLSR